MLAKTATCTLFRHLIVFFLTPNDIFRTIVAEIDASQRNLRCEHSFAPTLVSPPAPSASRVGALREESPMPVSPYRRSVAQLLHGASICEIRDGLTPTMLQPNVGPSSSAGLRGSSQDDVDLPPEQVYRSICCGDVDTLVQRLRNERCESVRHLILLSHDRDYGHLYSTEETRALRARVNETGQLTIPEKFLLDLFLARALAEQGDGLAALQLALRDVDLSEDDSFLQYVRCLQAHVCSVAHQLIGDLNNSFRDAERALCLSQQSSFTLQLECALLLARLQLSLSDPTNGFKTVASASIREFARRASQEEWLLQSHLVATQCALECKLTKKASQELAAAETLLEHDGSGRAKGLTLLHRGEIHVQRGDLDLAEGCFHEALEFFQDLKPIDSGGVLSAKTALGCFALYTGEFTLAFRVVQTLLNEATELECHEEAARLQLIESYLFLTAEPPSQRAFQHARTRVQTLRNPVLRLRVLANLFTYALSRRDAHPINPVDLLSDVEGALGERTEGRVSANTSNQTVGTDAPTATDLQSELLLAIHQQRRMLPPEHFDRLYQQFVRDRYADTVETLLIRHAEGDGGDESAA